MTMAEADDAIATRVLVAFSSEGRLWTEAEYISDVVAEAYVACVHGDRERQRRVLAEIGDACAPDIVREIRERVSAALLKRQDVPREMYVLRSKWRGSPLPDGIAERAMAAMLRSGRFAR